MGNGQITVSLLDLNLPNVDSTLFDRPTGARFAGAGSSRHAPRFLLLYGSLRERSYSKLLTLEAARLLIAMGGEVRVFDPAGLPLPDSAPETHSKVQELREAAAWAEGMVWTSPERHGVVGDNYLGGLTTTILAGFAPAPGRSGKRGLS
jgi:arsenic resistance protein ArsH